jgi:hypothetical protein
MQQFLKKQICKFSNDQSKKNIFLKSHKSDLKNIKLLKSAANVVELCHTLVVWVV